MLQKRVFLCKTEGTTRAFCLLVPSRFWCFGGREGGAHGGGDFLHGAGRAGGFRVLHIRNALQLVGGCEGTRHKGGCWKRQGTVASKNVGEKDNVRHR